MNKKEFLMFLCDALGKFDREEVEKIRFYYDELISDKVESGLSEEEAVASLGDIKNIVDTVKTDLLVDRSKSKNKNNRGLKNAVLLLGICASPILLPVGISFLAVFLVFIIVYAALLLSFGISAIACFLGVIPNVVGMSIHSFAFSDIIFSTGTILFVAGIMLLLTIATYYGGGKLLHGINKIFGLTIRKIIGGKE